GPQEARRLLEPAIRAVEEALPNEAGARKIELPRPVSRVRLRDTLLGLAESLLSLGDHDAARCAEKVPLLYPRDRFPRAWEGCRPAAGLVARCVPLARDAPALSEAERKEKAEAYATQAVALLRDALGRGWRNPGTLRDLPDLAPLAEHPEAVKLLGESRP